MPEEIEARYIVPDALLFERLGRLQNLGDLTLTPVGKARLRDEYVDTPGRALIRQGWACRLRSNGQTWVVTLKGPKRVDGAVLSRSELEIALPARTLELSRWPAGELHTQMETLTSGLPLREVVTIEQKRRRFTLADGPRAVAELSLDEVLVQSEGLRQETLMLEAELLPSGQRADLERLDVTLSGEYGLISESRSKLRRALDLIEHTAPLEEPSARRPEPISTETLLLRYGAEPTLARRGAELGAQLAELLGPELELIQEGAADVAMASGLLALAAVGDHPQGHLLAREILTRQPLVGVEPTVQAAVAAAVYLHRKALSPERLAEAVPPDWPEEARRQTLRIAALTRLAGALAEPELVAVRIRELRRATGHLQVLLEGENADRAAHRAGRRSDLWASISPTPLEWGIWEPSADGEVVTLAVSAKVLGLNPWDGMPLAAAKILGYYLAAMLAREAGTRQAEDPEELHAMRVATRRLRSALRLLAPYLPAVLARRANDGLRQLAAALGAVRDWDVALERAERYRDGLPAPEQPGLASLLASWSRQRAAALARLLHLLDSRRYGACVQATRELAAQLAATDPLAQAPRVVQVAPKLLYLHWQAVRAYQPLLADAPIELLHLLRIDCKRLRYGVEFFRDVLPEPTVALIPAIVAVQDCLGEMRDAVVSAHLVEAFLGRRHAPVAAQAARIYADACQADRQTRLEVFPEVWAALMRDRTTREMERLANKKA